MTRYSVQLTERIFVKDHEFLSFANNMGKNISKNICKNRNGKYSQKLLHHPKQSATDALKTPSKRAIQKTAEAIRDLIGNKIDNKITNVSKTSPQNNSEKIAHYDDKEIPKERYIYLQKINHLNLGQKIGLK